MCIVHCTSAYQINFFLNHALFIILKEPMSKIYKKIKKESNIKTFFTISGPISGNLGLLFP